MGNCAGSPKTNEGEEVPVPAPVAEEVKVEQHENTAEENAAETKAEELPVSSDDKSLGILLTENGEAKVEEPKTEEVKAEGKEENKPEKEEAKPETKEEKKPETEEAKPETKEEKPAAEKN